jgi:hypothetical protein
MDDAVANALIDFITAKEHNWTIIVSSNPLETSVQDRSQWKGTNYIRSKKIIYAKYMTTINMLLHTWTASKRLKGLVKTSLQNFK